ncbi:hypothetical protein NXS98_01885 [Fontisphaera persica]|uniref:hypothetical protein n=1 Tax=Fontisphaera persica TaxID=2974023 RepID=UPI0024C01905|nr:hypothetical protein [Fontisphaera persica]WCJ59897.1 hypothetical protein NXS98_01885 [Fontisphaera persica]
MKPKQPIAALLGGLLILAGLASLALPLKWVGVIPAMIGGSLLYLSYRPGRGATMLFGHACLVTGCLLVTWGIYLLPHSEPKLLHILGRPLFWGLISIFGGICANYHGFCRCVGAADAKSACSETPRCSAHRT